MTMNEKMILNLRYLSQKSEFLFIIVKFLNDMKTTTLVPTFSTNSPFDISEFNNNFFPR